MIPFYYKETVPVGSPDHDGEAEPRKSLDEELDDYYDYVDNQLKEEKQNEV